MRSRRSVSRRGPKRPSTWRTFLVQTNALELQYREGESEWFSFWALWPAGEKDPVDDEVRPVDETLIRYVGNAQVQWAAVVPAPTEPVSLVLGLIAFDGGTYPEFYEAATFLEGTSLVAPPNPILEADDDWIIRMPYQFTNDGQIQNTGDTTFLQSRAMRKLPPGTGILCVGAALSTVGPAPGSTMTLYSSWDGRLLCKAGQSA